MAPDLIAVVLLVATASLYAVMRGGKPERICAAIIVAGIVADRLYLGIFGGREFQHFTASRLAFDGAQLVGFVLVALRANRVWPLWPASAQLVAISGSVSAIVVPDGYNYAYWAMTQLPLFIQLAALGLGTFLHDRRRQRIGAYNCWSPRPAQIS